MTRSHYFNAPAQPKTRKVQVKAHTRTVKVPEKKPMALAPLGTSATQQLEAPQQAKSRRAAAKLPAPTDVPRLPVLKRYTPQQRRAVAKSFVDYASRHGGNPAAILAARNTADPQTRQYLNKVTAIGKSNDRELASVGYLPTAHNVLAKDMPKAKHMKFGGETKIAGLGIPGLHQLSYGVNGLLHNATRPEMAITGAIRAYKQGQDPLQGAIENFKSTRYSGSDLLRDAGLGKTPAAIGGLGLGIPTDPLNLVTAGAAPVAGVLVKEASHAGEIARQLRAAGHVEAAVKQEKRAAKLVQTAQSAPINRGIQVGLRLGAKKRITTTGASSARLAQTLQIPESAAKIHDAGVISRAGQFLSTDYRPKGVSPQDWEKFRAKEREARGSISKGQHTARKLQSAIEHELAAPGHDHTHILQALERSHKPPPPVAPGELPNLQHYFHTLDDLNPQDHKVASLVEGLNTHIGETEHAIGKLPNRRQNYVAHVPTADYLNTASLHHGSAIGVNPYARARQSEPIDVENALAAAAGHGPKFETNLGAIMAERVAKNRTLLAHHAFQQQTVAEHSHPLAGLNGQLIPPSSLRATDAVYVAGPQSDLKLVAGARDHGAARDILSANEKLQPGEHLVVMNKALGDRTVHGVLPGRSIDLKDDTAQGYLRAYDKGLGKFKTAVTILNAPTYQLRNFMGDTWNGRIGDATGKDVWEGAKVIAHRVSRDKHDAQNLFDPHLGDHVIDLGHGRSITASQALDLMERHHVVGGGHFGSEIAEQATKASGRYGLAQARHAGGKLAKKIRDKGQNMEDTTRAGTFIAALKRGLSPAEAAAWTAKHHFDYADLTHGERQFMKRVFPFWTFTARNTPLQARALVRRPGMLANYGLAQEEGRKQSGLPTNYQDVLPGYMQRQLSIPLNIAGHRTLLSPQLPLTDINRWGALASGNTKEIVQELGQMVTPIIKGPVEYGTNHSFFFRSPLYQDPTDENAANTPRWTQAPAPIAWLEKHDPTGVLPRVLAGNAEAGRKGLWSKKIDYLGRQLPQTSAAIQVATSKPGTRNQDWLDALLSQGTGVKVNQADKAAFLKWATDAQYQKVSQLTSKIKNAKQLGHTAQAKKLSHKRYELLKHVGPPKAKRSKGAYGVGNSSGYGGSSGSGYSSSSGGGY